MTKRKKDEGYPSGWYKSKEGHTFHALGKNMSQETIDAIGAIADAVHNMSKMHCPNCGGSWNKPLHWERDKGWFCDCGWKGEPVERDE